MKIRGFRFRFRLRKRLTRWITRRTRNPTQRVDPGEHRCGSISRLVNWGRRLIGSGSGYGAVGRVSGEGATAKGQVAVYVREGGGGYYRVMVPVVYCNHPLFGELLRAAEEEYGYDHRGGITIPCPMLDFETVQTKIAATVCGGRRRKGHLWV